MRQRLHNGRSDERGIGVLELIIATVVLSLAMVMVLGSLISTQETATFTAQRNQSLDDLRLTAARFTKDARHAASVTVNDQHRVVMQTYVNGTLGTVTYEVVNDGGALNMRRQIGSSTEIFVVRLTTNAVFAYDSTDHAAVRRITLRLSTQPDQRRSEVTLASEVTLRNVSTPS